MEAKSQRQRFEQRNSRSTISSRCKISSINLHDGSWVDGIFLLVVPYIIVPDGSLPNLHIPFLSEDLRERRASRESWNVILKLSPSARQ